MLNPFPHATVDLLQAAAAGQAMYLYIAQQTCTDETPGACIAPLLQPLCPQIKPADCSFWYHMFTM